MKSIIISALILSISSIALAKEPARSKIDATTYEIVHDSFFDQCMKVNDNEQHHVEARLWCSCTSTTFVANVKSAVKKKKLKYVEQILDVVDEAIPNAGQLQECRNSVASMTETW